MNRGPDFIGIGAEKAGTSWIYYCLHQHPSIDTRIKETYFFNMGSNWSKGFEWYESFFKHCHPTAKTGEFSPGYLTDPVAPEKIYKKHPNTKLIVSLRNPVDRAFSAYIFNIKRGKLRPTIPFNTAIKQDPEYL